MKTEFILGKRYSNHSMDLHLSYVLAKITSSLGQVEYVVWLRNSTLPGNGCNEGKYFRDILPAVEYFNTKGLLYCYPVDVTTGEINYEGERK